MDHTIGHWNGARGQAESFPRVDASRSESRGMAGFVLKLMVKLVDGQKSFRRKPELGFEHYADIIECPVAIQIDRLSLYSCMIDLN